MAEMICPKCGRNYSDDLLYCLDDGTRLNVVQEESEVETVAHPRIVIDTSRPLPDQEFCPSCGMPNTVGSRFCKKCGRAPTVDQSNINAQTTSRIGKTGILTTDTNLREEPDPNSDKVGTQFKGARIKVLEVAEVPNDEGGTSVWFHVQVTSYGKSIDPNNYGLEKDPDSKDEGWINSNPKVYDPSKKTQVHKRTVDFDDNK
jgi:hypothetical protein